MGGLRVVVEADGGSRGNPGPAGYGAVVREAGTGEVLAERSAALGVTTNNVAEYSGLIAGLAAAAELGAVEVEVRMDSKLVVEQMCGRWQIKHPGLRPLAAEAAALVRRFDAVTFEWIPRARNAHADRLANEAMDAAAGRSPRAGGTASALSAPAVPVASAPSVSPSSGSSASLGSPSPAVPSSPAVSSSAGPAVPRSWEPPTEQPVRLILVRHGETQLTSRGCYSGRGDTPLTPHGVAQAQAAANRVAALAPAVTAVISSPLSRCTRTARLIAAATGRVPVTIDDDLVECDFGDWEALTFAEVRKRWPAEMDAWLADPSVPPPGGESFHQVAARVERVVARMRRRQPGDTVVLVSHVSPIKLLLRDALAATDALLYRLYLDPAGVSVVDLWSDGGVAVRAVNDTAHLPAPPPPSS